MKPKRKRRMIAILVILAGVGAATMVATRALKENLLFFVSPSDVYSEQVPAGRQIRLGGLVSPGSLTRAPDGLQVQFTVTDGLREVVVQFDGILPDLFREGQGIIAIGALEDNGRFAADEVLAKHDENYMPPEVADALDKAGHPGVEAAE